MLISLSLNASKKMFVPTEVQNIEQLAELASTKSISLGVFKNNHRTLDNFESCEAIGLDIDNAQDMQDKGYYITVDQALELFKDYKHIILTSKSHQLEKNGLIVDRFRVFLFLSEPIKDIRDFYATWDSLQKRFPFIDPQCKDASRFWFASPGIKSISEPGILIDPVKSSKNLPGTKWTTLNDTIESSEKGKLSKATWTFIREGAPAGHWNGSLFKAAKDMQEQRYDIEEAMQMLERATILPGNAGHLDSTDVETIRSAYKVAPRHQPRLDFNSSIRNVILSCHLIVDEQDHLRTHLVDLATGERFNISKENIKAVLTREEFNDFMRYRSIVALFTYNPYAKKIIFDRERGLLGYNMYTPPHWLRSHYYNDEPLEIGNIPGCIDEFLNHLTNRDEPSKQYILDWLATALTNRNYTILTAIGDQGIGKGVFGHLCESIFGVSNFKKTRDEVFKKSFNAQLEDKRFIYIDELALVSKEAHDRMKDIVNDTIEIEAKGKDAKTITNYASFYISSNHIDALKLEPDDRRISAVELTEVPLLKVFTRDQIEQQILSKENVAQFAQYLYHRVVERDMRIPFRSNRFNEMMEAGLKNWQRYVVFDLANEFRGKVIDVKEIQQRIQVEFPTMTAPGVTQITKLARVYADQIAIAHRPSERGKKYIEFLTPKEAQ